MPAPDSIFTKAKKTELTCRVSEPFFALQGGKTTDKSGEQKPRLGVSPIVITEIGYCAPLTAGAIRIGDISMTSASNFAKPDCASHLITVSTSNARRGDLSRRPTL